jgi:voltage-gated potassium channel
MSTQVAAEIEAEPKRSNAYDLFILVLTVLSLVIMLGLVLPWLNPPTKKLLNIYDNLICVVFLYDFAWNFSKAHPRRDYVVGRRGWLDLLGSIPSFGFFQYTALLRLARLSRLARITRLMRAKNKREIVADIRAHRGQYAVFITLLAAMIVLMVASVLVLQFESSAPNGNIKTGGEALWWAVVTLTTVGYGDFYPVTLLGRLTGVLVMFTGIGIIGALASILASILVAPNQDEAPEEASMREELVAIRSELVALRASLGRGDQAGHL